MRVLIPRDVGGLPIRRLHPGGVAIHSVETTEIHGWKLSYYTLIVNCGQGPDCLITTEQKIMHT